MRKISRHRSLQLLYMLADAIATELVWFCFLYFRWLILDKWIVGWNIEFVKDAFTFSISNSSHPFFVYPLCCCAIFYLSGYYLHPGKDKWSNLIANTFVCSLIISVSAFFFIIIDDLTSVSELSRYPLSLTVLFTLQTSIVLAERIIMHIVFQKRTHRERIVLNEDGKMDDQTMYQAISRYLLEGKEIVIVPKTIDVISGAAKVVNIEDTVPYIVLTDSPLSDWGQVTKRMFDLLFSITMLILLSPVLLFIAIRIKTDSPGPVIYKQQRIGLWGQPFTILKFRTMQDHAEDDVPRLSYVNDSRITRIGHFLRKYRMDELPQFINIIRGDMSVVGPRPERAYFIRQIMEKAPYYCLLYKIRPGLTSWGPIKVGYTDTIDKMIQRLQYDIAYMENMSLILDIKILYRTIRVLVDGRGQ